MSDFVDKFQVNYYLSQVNRLAVAQDNIILRPFLILEGDTSIVE